jgi:hypothetical protein
VVPANDSRRLGAFRQVLVGETSQPAIKRPSSGNFSRICGIGTHLELISTSTRDGNGRQKGRRKMSDQLKFSRTLVAAVAALLFSTVTVGAAVGPAQAVASPVGVSANA